MVEFRPALNTETFFERMYGLARDGKLDENGVPPFLQTAIISSANGIYLPRPPIVMQKVLFALLIPVGRFMGFRASYPSYSGEDAPEADSEGAGEDPGRDLRRHPRRRTDTSAGFAALAATPRL